MSTRGNLVEIAHDVVSTLSGSTSSEPRDFEEKAQRLITRALERAYRCGVEDAAVVAADEHTGLLAPPALTRLVTNIRKLLHKSLMDEVSRA